MSPVPHSVVLVSPARVTAAQQLPAPTPQLSWRPRCVARAGCRWRVGEYSGRAPATATVSPAPSVARVAAPSSVADSRGAGWARQEAEHTPGLTTTRDTCSMGTVSVCWDQDGS